MQPQQDNNTKPPVQQPPIPPTLPQTQPVPQAPSVQSNPQPKKKHTTAIIIISVIAVLVLIMGALFVFYVLPTYRGVQARAAISADIALFFDAADRQDEKDLISLLGSNATDEEKQFILDISQTAGSDCKQDSGSVVGQGTPPITYKATASCSDGVSWNFTFAKDAETDKWIISSIVGGGSGHSTTSSSSQETMSGCLTRAEAAETGYDSGEVTGTFDAGGYIIGDTMFFEADSTEYTYPDQAIEKMNSLAKWGAKYSSKKWTLTIQGRVNETSLSSVGQQLAKQRADKVKTYLTDKGIPADKIKTDVEVASSSSAPDVERNVGLVVNGDSSCSSTQ